MLQIQFARYGPVEELRVLGQRARPAAFDEAHTQRVQQPGNGELVGHRVRNPLSLGAVAQRGVVEVELVTEGGAGGTGAGHRRSSKSVLANKKDPPRDARGLRAGRWCLATGALGDNEGSSHSVVCHERSVA